jgi:hypothetical protein
MNERSLDHRINCSKLGPAILAGLVALAWTGAARASDDADPFANEGASPSVTPEGAPTAVPSNSKVPPAPAASPPESAAALAPGIVEQLPASAYPQPYTRGLYGGPLWQDMQGLQWPYIPQTGVGISGYGWVDGNYRLIRSGNPSISPRFTELIDQGRFVLRVTPTYTNGTWFVQAQAEIVANTDQYNVQPAPSVVAADDVWVRTGELQQWDVTFGRFQAFDVYPLGMGLDLNTYERLGAFDPAFTGSPNGFNAVPALYGADYLLYRPAAPKVGDVALHLYQIRPLRVELLGQFGSDGTENYLGARPAAIFDVGWLKLRGALEYQYKFAEDPAATAKNTIKNRGGAGSVQLVFAPFVEFGVNVGYAVIDVADAQHPTGMGNTALSGNRLSYGGFIDVVPLPSALPNLMLGAGGNFATFHNLLTDPTTNENEKSTNTQAYLAAQYLFYRQLYFKVVFGYAKSHFQNLNTATPYDDDMFSVRVRLMYLY